MRTVLFVCTGNTCRSPMAEALAQHWLGSSEGSFAGEVLVASAGVAAGEGAAVSPETLQVLAQRGIEHSGRSKPLTREMIRGADRVLCMTRAHAEAARALVAGEELEIAKIVLLDPEGDVSDPIGFGQEAYDEVAERLEQVIPARLKELLQDADRTGIGSSRRGDDSRAS